MIRFGFVGHAQHDAGKEHSFADRGKHVTQSVTYWSNRCKLSHNPSTVGAPLVGARERYARVHLPKRSRPRIPFQGTHKGCPYIFARLRW